MNTASEKELYSGELRETAMGYDADYFIWGEELIDYKLVLYTKKLKEVEGYQEVKDILTPCALVLIDTGKKHRIRCVPATLDAENRQIYLIVSNFNAMWNRFRLSVQLGIEIANESGQPCSIDKPEDIVDLCNLMRPNSIPYVKSGTIQYKVREQTAEERSQNSRRQSLLDNPKMNYFYDSSSGVVHDKECRMVKEISAAQFCASEEIPEGMQLCPKCMRIACFRKACAPNTKQIPVCSRIFKNNHVHNDKIRHFVMDAGLKLHATSLDALIVEGAQDTWIIKGKDEYSLQLWHNNYIKINETERYITEGFHNQGLNGKTMVQMLRYIEGYTWEKHLQAEAARAAAAAEKKAVVPAAETPAAQGIEENRKIPWYVKVKNWVCRVFRRRG